MTDRIDDSKLMHGDSWEGEDLSGWLLSEKLDGCRAYWDGERMWTRNGNVVAIPAAWSGALPPLALDGEIWAGRGGFFRAMVATQRGRFVPGIRFMVFDAPGPGPFEKRLAAARRALRGLRFARMVKHTRVAATADAMTFAAAIKAGGGEGIIARHPLNHYRPGRTREILKLTVIERVESEVA